MWTHDTWSSGRRIDAKRRLGGPSEPEGERLRSHVMFRSIILIVIVPRLCPINLIHYHTLHFLHVTLMRRE